MNVQKKENLFGWLLFSVVLSMKICSIITLCAIHREHHHDLPHESHTFIAIKDKKMISYKPKKTKKRNLIKV